MVNGQVISQGEHQGQKRLVAIIMKETVHMKVTMASSDMCAPFLSSKSIETP